ncbi:Os11g0577050 [Oryza sativa Japonica Group]|uniref:Os11g0577050 protein n=1 Tax=Oryza sativa subsp. japonica TaxID=39947 RepID=A0A0P0Y3S4_ORYSJ|nr:Os11g0577050 [Oryza sativa Japonica Group]
MRQRISENKGWSRANPMYIHTAASVPPRRDAVENPVAEMPSRRIEEGRHNEDWRGVGGSGQEGRRGVAGCRIAAARNQEGCRSHGCCHRLQDERRRHRLQDERRRRLSARKGAGAAGAACWMSAVVNWR